MKFVISYSCGKDSTLALHRMTKGNHEPIALLVMCNEADHRSWFHGVDDQLLNKIARSLNIPLLKCVSQGEDYHLAFENGLKRAKALGAEACVFGDIDLEGHKEWATERCENAGLHSEFPLWQEDREQITVEFVLSGYQAIIKCISNKHLPKDFLGKQLDLSLIKALKELNVDVCGENGEYHTIVIDGPLFKEKIELNNRGELDLGDYTVLDLT
jgi:diphthine-ammonia ligase